MLDSVNPPKPTPAERGQNKISRIPIKVVPSEAQVLPRKPAWIRVKAPTSPAVAEVKKLLREQQLHTVCEEAACPNLGECFAHGTATFMILGDRCTRRCPFCDVAHGRPFPPDPEEPRRLAQAVSTLGLRYVVITSVDRDDLRDGGASHFAACIAELRQRSPALKIEILVPDFRKRSELALDILSEHPPDVFNHNLETVPRLYREVRPGADYQGSLRLLQGFKARHGQIPTKSGIMLGLGETMPEVHEVLQALRQHDCDMVTVGQYLQPSRYHLPVARFVTPAEFAELADYARALGFQNVASGPLVRSSYHADLQAQSYYL
jgi:lipoyl synthase